MNAAIESLIDLGHTKEDMLGPLPWPHLDWQGALALRRVSCGRACIDGSGGDLSTSCFVARLY